MNATNKTDIDPSRCPLCGQANGCEVHGATMGGGECGTDDCWCRSETFTPGLLERIPSEQRRQACICRNCVREAAALAYDASSCEKES